MLSYINYLKTNALLINIQSLVSIIKHIVLIIIKEHIVIDKHVQEVWYLINLIVLKISLLNAEEMENALMEHVFVVNHIKVFLVKIM